MGWNVLGPATVVSVAYVDPGNFGANIEAGMRFGLSLLWVVWLSGALSIVVQYAAGMVGVKRGAGIFDLVRRRWLAAPVGVAVVLATDMAEYMGVVLGLHFLFGLPYEAAAVVGFADVALLAALADRRNLFVKVIGAMVAAIAVSFLVQLYLVKPDWAAVLRHSVTPTLSGEEALVAAAIVGATIMPHAVVLHSHLAVGQRREEHLRQTVVNLLGAAAINASILISSAYMLHGADADVADVPKLLEPLYGPLSAYLFSLAMLLSGLSSSSAVSVEFGLITARLLLGRPVSAWKARLAARAVNVAPAVLALTALGMTPLSVLVYTQFVLAAALPAVLAMLWACSKGAVGGAVRTVVGAAALYAAALTALSILAGV